MQTHNVEAMQGTVSPCNGFPKPKNWLCLFKSKNKLKKFQKRVKKSKITLFRKPYFFVRLYIKKIAQPAISIDCKISD